MEATLKFSNASVACVKRYIHVTNDDELINIMLSSAKGYIKSYTGLDEERLDEIPEIVIALFTIVSEMYDNRSMHSNGESNHLIDSILSLHSENLL